MPVIKVDFAAKTSSPFAEVLTSATGEHLVGYHLGGHSTGPDVVIMGHDPMATLVYDRLIALPTLSWLRGSLMLINLTALAAAGENSRVGALFAQKPDELVLLPYHPRVKDAAEAAVTKGYWSILQTCADMGMISGRGVPPAPAVAGADAGSYAPRFA